MVSLVSPKSEQIYSNNGILGLLGLTTDTKNGHLILLIL